MHEFMSSKLGCPNNQQRRVRPTSGGCASQELEFEAETTYHSLIGCAANGSLSNFFS